MKRTLILLSILVVAGLFFLAGCSKQTTGSDTSDSGLNFEGDFGGYDASDEAPGFGDEVIMDDISAKDEELSLDSEMGPIFDSIGNAQNVQVYSMRILWGMLEFDSTVTEVTNWSGSLTVERGGIRMVSTIRFERGDYIIRPRTDRMILSWESNTVTHFDGISFVIYDLPDLTGETENSVTFTTGPYTRTFTMAELEDLSEIVNVGDIGNKVSFDAVHLNNLECENGTLDGRWIKKGQRNGVYYGRWVSDDGHFMGYVRGHWGENNSGEKVMFGKWVNEFGHFRGLIRGTWGVGDAVDAADPAQGWYEGVWANGSGRVEGDLSGSWSAAPDVLDDGDGSGYGTGDGTGNGDMDRDRDRDGSRYGGEVGGIPERGHGFFEGRWQQICPE